MYRSSIKKTEVAVADGVVPLDKQKLELKPSKIAAMHPFQKWKLIIIETL